MTNIFLGISQNQIFSYEAILKININSEKNILVTNETLHYDKSLWDSILFTEGTFDNTASGPFSSIFNIYIKIKKYKKILTALEKYRKLNNICLYFTYIEDILTNHILFSFNKDLKGVVVEDGMLNYYNHTINNISTRKMYLKWLISNCMGVRYKFYKGHSSGIEYDHVIKQYVKLPELSFFPKKAVQLPYKRYDFESTETALIIGQEAYINMFGIKRYSKALKDLLVLLREKPYFKHITKIYYKPHRNGQRIDYNLIRQHVNDKTIDVLKGEIPLEGLYFEKLRSKYIFSFDSTVMMNIYLESSFESKKELDFNVLLKYNKDLYPVFKKFNFNIYS